MAPKSLSTYGLPKTPVWARPRNKPAKQFIMPGPESEPLPPSFSSEDLHREHDPRQRGYSIQDHGRAPRNQYMAAAPATDVLPHQLSNADRAPFDPIFDEPSKKSFAVVDRFGRRSGRPPLLAVDEPAEPALLPQCLSPAEPTPIEVDNFLSAWPQSPQLEIVQPLASASSNLSYQTARSHSSVATGRSQQPRATAASQPSNDLPLRRFQDELERAESAGETTPQPRKNSTSSKHSRAPPVPQLDASAKTPPMSEGPRTPRSPAITRAAGRIRAKFSRKERQRGATFSEAPLKSPLSPGANVNAGSGDSHPAGGKRKGINFFKTAKPEREKIEVLHWTEM